MKFCLFIFASSLIAQTPQPTLTLGPAATASPGQTASIPLNLTESAGAGITTLQFTITVPVGLTLGIPQATGQASAAAVICGPLVPTNPPSTVPWPAIVTSMPCYLFGQTVATDGSGVVTVNEDVLSDGIIASIPITILSGAPGSIATIALTEAAATKPNGTDVAPVALGSLPFTLPIGQASCDLNGDGKIDGADVQIAELQLIGKQPQTVAWVLNLINVSELINTAVRISLGLPSACVMQ